MAKSHWHHTSFRDDSTLVAANTVSILRYVLKSFWKEELQKLMLWENKQSAIS